MLLPLLVLGVRWIAALPLIAAAIAIYRFTPPLVQPENSGLWWLPLPLCLWTCLLVHELGHVIFGALAGYRWRYSSVTPLHL